jgi:hypothetical protein
MQEQILDNTHPLESPSERLRPLAAAWHTILVLVVIAASAVRGYFRTSLMRAGYDLNRISLYERTLLFEWLLLALVLWGVWLNGCSLFEVLGERWRSGKQLLADVGLGMSFLISSILVTSIIGGHGESANRSIQFLLPQRADEKALWVVLSITAGICEEAVYRGYLQKQFIAMTRSVPAGIAISALLFAGSHLYQGAARVTVIAVMAVCGGILAQWRGSVRPGMIAHGLQDLLGGFLRH